MELIKANPSAFILAFVTAYRGQYRAGFNQHNLGLGESLLGDYASMGLTEQQYRTAKAQLANWKFATFTATNKGTVGKLIDSRLFSIFRIEGNEQNNERATSKQRASNGRVTTTKNLRAEERKTIRGEGPLKASSVEVKKQLTSSERISAEKQLERTRQDLEDYRNQLPQVAGGETLRSDVDRMLIASLKADIRRLEELLKL